MSANGNESVANSDPHFDPPGFRSRGVFVFLTDPELLISALTEHTGIQPYLSFLRASVREQSRKPKRPIVILGADHTFTLWPHRLRAIRETVKLLLRFLG